MKHKTFSQNRVRYTMTTLGLRLRVEKKKRADATLRHAHTCGTYLRATLLLHWRNNTP